MSESNLPESELAKFNDINGDRKILINAVEMIQALDASKVGLEGGVIPSKYLPSYVDDVVEYDSKEPPESGPEEGKTYFPEEGEKGKIYVATDTNTTYRWSGSGYVQVGGSDVALIDAADEDKQTKNKKLVVGGDVAVIPGVTSPSESDDAAGKAADAKTVGSVLKGFFIADGPPIFYFDDDGWLHGNFISNGVFVEDYFAGTGGAVSCDGVGKLAFAVNNGLLVIIDANGMEVARFVKSTDLAAATKLTPVFGGWMLGDHYSEHLFRNISATYNDGKKGWDTSEEMSTDGGETWATMTVGAEDNPDPDGTATSVTCVSATFNRSIIGYRLGTNPDAPILIEATEKPEQGNKTYELPKPIRDTLISTTFTSDDSGKAADARAVGDALSDVLESVLHSYSIVMPEWMASMAQTGIVSIQALRVGAAEFFGDGPKRFKTISVKFAETDDPSAFHDTVLEFFVNGRSYFSLDHRVPKPGWNTWRFAIVSDIDMGSSTQVEIWFKNPSNHGSVVYNTVPVGPAHSGYQVRTGSGWTGSTPFVSMAKSDIPAVVAPSASTATGQAADAKAVDKALKGKLDKTGGLITGSVTVMDYGGICVQDPDDSSNVVVLLLDAILRQYGDSSFAYGYPDKEGTLALTSDIADATKLTPVYGEWVFSDGNAHTISKQEFTAGDYFWVVDNGDEYAPKEISDEYAPSITFEPIDLLAPLTATRSIVGYTTAKGEYLSAQTVAEITTLAEAAVSAKYDNAEEMRYPVYENAEVTEY